VSDRSFDKPAVLVSGPVAEFRDLVRLAEPASCACGHPVKSHDATASRYCDATTLNQLQRGCICAVVALAAPYRQ
jgi:hypothetical protein